VQANEAQPNEVHANEVHANEVHANEVDEVTDALLTASRVLVAVAATSLGAVGDEVTLAQYRTLVILQSRGPQGLLELAGELQVVPSTATRMCDRLVRKGLIDRSVSDDNRREVDVRITDAGRAIVDRVARRRRSSLRRVVADMPSADRRALVRALESFAEAAGEVPEAQWYLGWR
jgi:DNA-binding MarR family transcriptional regulator